MAAAFACGARADVFVDVPEATVENYQVLYSLDIPVNGAFQGATPVPYSVNNSASAGTFDRVAYYLELTKADSTRQWVYVSMDAFTTNAVKLGLPHNVSNAVKFQQSVTNLNVLSNVSGVVAGKDLEGGCIEMWPSNYGAANDAGFYAASASVLDWGDGEASTAAGYGSFQVHNALAKQTLLAYNRWGVNDGSNDDTGIGNQASGSSDWTFSGSAAGYASRKLVILVRPKVLRFTLTKMPRNGQLYPRNLQTSLAAVPISGTIDAPGAEKVSLQIYRNGTALNRVDQTLSYPPTGGAPFAFAPEIPAEAASYDFELIVTKGGQEESLRRVKDVVAGDAYLFYGQSNMEATRAWVSGNTSSAAYSSPWVRTFGQNADSGAATRNNPYWVQANGDGGGSYFIDPGAVGQWAIVVGRKIFDTYHVPVALINGARGGYLMSKLQKDDAQPDNLDDSGGVTRPYNRMRYRSNLAGVAAKARAMFYYQGESDNGDAASYSAGYAGLMQDWAVDYPGLEHFYQVQVRPGCTVSVIAGSVALREVQRQIGDKYPRTTVTTGNGISAHDGCHFSFINGYETLGLQHFRLVSRDLYGAPDAPNIEALNPATVEFADATRKRIRVVMRDAGATINFPVGALGDFGLVGGAANIVSRTVSGNSFTLELDQAVDADAILEYRSHLGTGNWVTNGNGVGLLAFAIPVGPVGPKVTLSAPAGGSDAAEGGMITVSATAAPGPNGAAVRMVFYANEVPQFETNSASLSTTWRVPAAGAYRLSVAAFDSTGASGRAAVPLLAGQGSTPGGASTGLVAWFRADKGIVRDASNAVTTWQDQSGNNRNAVQASSLAKPRYVSGLFGATPGVFFDGNDWLTASAGMPTGSYSKVVRFKAATGSYSNNLVSSNIEGTTSARDHALYAPNLLPTMFHSGSTVASARPVVANADSIVVATFDAATKTTRIYLNGTLAGSGLLAGNNTKTSFQLGAYKNESGLYGAISEVLIYDHVLSDSERVTVTNYLNEKSRTPFQRWRNSAFAGQDNSPTGDNDGDGLSNVMEYALGHDPLTPDPFSFRLPRVQVVGDDVVVKYQRAVDHPDVIVHLQRSQDLVNWSEVGDTSAGVEDNLETRQFVQPLSASEPAYFYRLEVILP
jgi:hypothetical protein